MSLRGMVTGSRCLIVSILLHCAVGVHLRNHTVPGNSSTSRLAEPERTAVSSLPPSGSSEAFTTTASDQVAASSCWKEWDAYSAWSTHCPKTTSTGSIYTLTDDWTFTSYKTYKLCDGHPRASAQGGWRTSYSTMSDVTYPFQTVTLSTVTYEFPPSGTPVSTVTTTDVRPTTELITSCAQPTSLPSCTIDSDNCKSLFSAWTAGGFTRSKPPCYYDMPTAACDNCALYVPTVKLLYFPVSMTGNFCDDNYRTATPTHNGNLSTPSTIVWSGTTLTSGYVYLSYAGVTAIADGGTTCGPTKPAGLLPIPSTSLFSYRGHAAAMPIAGDIQWPFNFADLAPNPVPWDAWISQDLCYNHQDYSTCQTITQEAYRPWLVYPEEFFTMESAWRKCGSGAFGIMDPPTALPKADVVAVPTMSTTGDGFVEASGLRTRTRSGSLSPETPVLSAKTTKIEQKPYKQGQDPVEATKTDPRDEAKSTASGSDGQPHLADPNLASSSPPDRTTATPKGTTTAIAKSAPRHSTLSIGTMPLVAASQTGAVSMGTHLISEGHTIDIGPTHISVGTGSVVVSVDPTSTTHPQLGSMNGLSILSAAQTKGKPAATFVMGEETLTAYSGGVVVGPETTHAPGHSKITVSGHTIELLSEGIVVDSATMAFDPVSKTVGQTVRIAFAHRASTTTLLGTVDPAGQTIFGISSQSRTYRGQALTLHGIAFSAMASTSGPATGVRSSSSLPEIVTARPPTGSMSLPPIVDPNSSASHLGPEQSTTTSGCSRWIWPSRTVVTGIYILMGLLMLLVG